MPDSETPSAGPPQVLGYATPNVQRKRPNLWLCLACFILAFLFVALITAIMEGWRRLDWPSILDFFAGAPQPVGANSVGFIAGFLIFRPYADVHKWRAYLMAVAAGAIAFFVEAWVFTAGRKFNVLNSELILPLCFSGGLIATCVLFSLYRVAFDRRVSGGSRIDR